MLPNSGLAAAPATMRERSRSLTVTFSTMGTFSEITAGSGSLTIVRSTIDHNMAEASGGIGASGITTIIDSTINDNRAFLGRAGGLAVSGVTRITNTTIASNSALAFSGGGLLAAGSV